MPNHSGVHLCGETSLLTQFRKTWSIRSLYQCCWELRLLHYISGSWGCKIGKKVFMETTEITEFDLVTIGDNSALNFGSTIQTHLFEDRVMKMSGCQNRKRVYDRIIISNSVRYRNAEPLYSKRTSLIMKGETLPENTNWQGSPCQLQNKEINERCN